MGYLKRSHYLFIAIVLIISLFYPILLNRNSDIFQIEDRINLDLDDSIKASIIINYIQVASSNETSIISRLLVRIDAYQKSDTGKYDDLIEGNITAEINGIILNLDGDPDHKLNSSTSYFYYYGEIIDPNDFEITLNFVFSFDIYGYDDTFTSKSELSLINTNYFLYILYFLALLLLSLLKIGALSPELHLYKKPISYFRFLYLRNLLLTSVVLFVNKDQIFTYPAYQFHRNFLINTGALFSGIPRALILIVLFFLVPVLIEMRYFPYPGGENISKSAFANRYDKMWKFTIYTAVILVILLLVLANNGDYLSLSSITFGYYMVIWHNAKKFSQINFCHNTLLAN